MKRLIICPVSYCNFNCSFCGFRKSKNKESLSLYKIKVILDEAKKRKIRILHITGRGEPLLEFNKVIKIIQLAKKRGFKKIGVNTNGSYVLKSRELIKKLKKAGLDKIAFSVDYDHLQFISYSAVIQAIKDALDEGIKVIIKTVNRKDTRKENLILIHKISKDLGGMLLHIPFINSTIFLILVHKKIVILLNYNFINSDITQNELKKELKKINLKKAIFKPCDDNVVVDSNLNIFTCGSFHCLNNSNLYRIGKINNTQVYYKFDPFLSELFFSRFGFIKMYLRIFKDKNLRRLIAKENFYSKCDFCLWVLKKRKYIQKVPISNLELLFFVILHFPLYFITIFQKLFDELYKIKL